MQHPWIHSRGEYVSQYVSLNLFFVVSEVHASLLNAVEGI